MIELQGITKSFGTLQVLKGIDLMIEKRSGKYCGASGAGKTTLLQIMGKRWIRRIRVLFY